MKQILSYYVNRMKNRFWKSVRKTDSCWLWTGSQDTRGYGQIVICGILQSPHRLSWVIHHGRIPYGLHVLHKCDVRLCVNPEHLFVGTNTDNIKDKMAKQRHRFGENHNKAKLTEEEVLEIRNSYVPPPSNKILLAKKYGVCQASIHAILIRKTWRHI